MTPAVRFAGALGTAATITGLLVLAPQTRAAPDNTLGMAILSAQVSAAGALLGGSGATTATRPLTGLYFVTFDRDVSNCAYFPALSTAGGSYASGMIAATAIPNDVNQVGVGIYQAGSTPENRDFHVLVFCNK